MIVDRNRYLYLTDAEFMEVNAILQAIRSLDQARKYTFNDVDDDIAVLFRESLDPAYAPLSDRLSALEHLSTQRDRVASKIIESGEASLDIGERSHVAALRELQPSIFTRRTAA